jgi:hypothetical protein
MTFKLIIILIMLINMSFAKDKTNDFFEPITEVNQISPSELLYSFYLKGEVFILSPDGEKLLSPLPTSSEWMFNGKIGEPLESNWVVRLKNLTMAINHKWIVQEDGKILVEIKYYDDIKRKGPSSDDLNYGKLIKEEKFILKDFSPLNLEFPDKNQKIVARLTPNLWNSDSPINIENLPLNIKNAVLYDGQGRVWAKEINIPDAAKYLGITTHLGTIRLSYQPFKNAKIIGTAKYGRIRISDGDTKLVLQSEEPYLAKGIKANIYGIIQKNIKTESISSVRTFTSDKEEKFNKK